MFTSKFRPFVTSLAINNARCSSRLLMCRSVIRCRHPLIASMSTMEQPTTKLPVSTPQISDIDLEVEKKDIHELKLDYLSALDSCQKSGDVQIAVSLIKEMIEKNLIFFDIHLFDGILNNCSRNGDLTEALELIEIMETVEIEPTLKSYNFILGATVKRGAYSTALQIIDLIKSSGIQPNVASYTSLMQCYGTCRMFSEVLEVFEFLKKESGVGGDDPSAPSSHSLSPTTYTYSALLKACAKIGNVNYAFETLKSMVRDSSVVKPNLYCYNIMISLCFEYEQYERLTEVFDLMKEQGDVKPDQVSFQSMIHWANKREQFDKVLEFYDLAKAQKASRAFYTMDVSLFAASRLGNSEKALEIFNDMKSMKNIYGVHNENPQKYKHLISSFMKLKKYDEALEVFRSFKPVKKQHDDDENSGPDAEAITALICCYMPNKREKKMKHSQNLHQKEVNSGVEMEVVEKEKATMKEADKKSFDMMLEDVLELVELHKINPDKKMFQALASVCNVTQQPWETSIKVLDLMNSYSLEPNFDMYKQVLENLERHEQGEHALAIMNRGVKLGVVKLWNHRTNVINLKLRSLLLSKSVVRYLLQYYVTHYDVKHQELVIEVGNGKLKGQVKQLLLDANFPHVTEFEESDDDYEKNKGKLILTSRSIEKFIYFNAFEEPPLLNLLPKWIYF